MSKIHECVECGWLGTNEEKVAKKETQHSDILICPKCGYNEFYLNPCSHNSSSVLSNGMDKCDLCGEILN